MTGAVVAVIGGRGGVGASAWAALLAAAAAPATLIDCDGLGGGIDVLLGVEALPGARWSGLRVGGGRLDPAVLDAGLPRWGAVRVLAADVAPDPDALTEVVDAAAELGPVLLDLPRESGALREVGLALCALCVVLVRADVSGLAAARALVATLPAVPAGLVVRGSDVSSEAVAEIVGLPVLGVVSELSVSRPSREALELSAGIADGLGVHA